MPVHDWTRVDAGIFHAFHTGWTAALQGALNDGLLPKGYYALAEQHARSLITDVLMLHASPEPTEAPWIPPDTGGIALAEAPPRTQRTFSMGTDLLARRRSLAIRHVSGHRLIALVEIISPANKDRAQSVQQFADKAAAALDRGVHVLMIDLFPPGPHDPHGMHGIIHQRIEGVAEAYDLPEKTPLTMASYRAGPQVNAYVEHFPVDVALREMPLFLRPDRYVNVPLEPTYQRAYREMPEFWREVLAR